MTQCCNDFGQCTQGADCLARASSIESILDYASSVPPFQCCPMREKSPQKELASDAIYFLGFIALVVVIFCIAGFAWAMLQHFYPSTACMVQMLFSTTCQ